VASSFVSSLSQYFGSQLTTAKSQIFWPEQLLPPIVRYFTESKPPPESLLGKIQNIIYSLVIGALSSPTLFPTVILTSLLSIFLFMSWSSRLGGWAGRLSSPFASPSPTAPTQVTDQDFSYITSEDIAKSTRPPRDTDAILLKHRRVSYPVHFPAYSIDDGELTIGAIRKSAAKKVDLPETQTSRIKLFYRGKNLKDDGRTAREEGMRSDQQAEILLVVGDSTVLQRPDSSGDEEEVEEGPGKSKKKRNRRKNKKSGKSATGTAGSSGASTPVPVNPDATFAPSAAPPPAPAPSAPKPILTPIEKLETLASLFHTTLVPECIKFMASPPDNEGKRDFEHKRLTETILTQVLLKLDAVETDGDNEARLRRKALVKETQGMLNQLDAAAKNES
jgi:BAG domain-containing protein